MRKFPELLEAVTLLQNGFAKVMPISQPRLGGRRVSHVMHPPRSQGRIEHLEMTFGQKFIRARLQTLFVELDRGPSKGPKLNRPGYPGELRVWVRPRWPDRIADDSTLLRTPRVAHDRWARGVGDC